MGLWKLSGHVCVCGGGCDVNVQSKEVDVEILRKSLAGDWHQFISSGLR